MNYLATTLFISNVKMALVKVTVDSNYLAGKKQLLSFNDSAYSLRLYGNNELKQ